MCTATSRWDNSGNELQLAWRLHILTEEARFKPLPEDRPTIRILVTNTTMSPYSRMCAAYFLADSEAGARTLLTNYAASTNRRHRFNAARTIQWFAAHSYGEPCEWAKLELIKLLENRSLELPSDFHSSLQNSEEKSMDMDDALTPIGSVAFTLGKLRDARAIPALKSLIERKQRGEHEAVYALGKIGDASVAPFLLSKFNCEEPIPYSGALAMLKYRPAVPQLVECLRHPLDGYAAAELLRNLLEIGDPSAIPEIEKFAKSPLDEELRKAAVRTLALMRATDPCGVLLTLLDKEQDEHETIELIRALGRYRDERATRRLFVLAVSSEHTILRGNAIGALGEMEDQQALLALVSVVETNAPPPTDFDKLAILAGRPVDYSKKEAARTLREVTRQDFGEDAAAWRRWIMENAKSHPL